MGFDPISAVAGGVLGVGSAFLQERFALKNQHQAQDYNTQMYANRYQMQTEDMKRAGLNPMLAAGQGPGGAPTASAASAPNVDIGRNVNDTRLASAQEHNIAASTAKMIQEAKTGAASESNINADTLGKLNVPALIAAQTVQANASAAQADMTVKRIRAEIPELEQRVKTLKSQAEKNKSDVQLNNAYIQAQEYLNGLRAAETFLINSKIRNTQLEGDILGPKAKAAKTTTGELGAVADNIGKIGSAAQKFISPFKGE